MLVLTSDAIHRMLVPVFLTSCAAYRALTAKRQAHRIDITIVERHIILKIKKNGAPRLRFIHAGRKKFVDVYALKVLLLLLQSILCRDAGLYSTTLKY